MSTKIAIVGTGNISEPYVKDILTCDSMELVGVADINQQAAQELAQKYKLGAYESVEALMDDESVSIVVNLTPPQVHPLIIRQAFAAGKHVYSEKPLATTYAEASALLAEANQQGLRLACSPFTFGGEAQQTVWKYIRENRLGKLRVAYAEVNWARIESWHPAPQAFYEVGPLFDVGVYPLVLLTAILGSVKNVSAYGTIIYPDRVTKDGIPFTPTSPDFVVAMLEMTSGTILRLTANFYVGHHNKQIPGIEFHGDTGSLHISSWSKFDTKVEYSDFGGQYEAVPLVRQPQKEGVPWGFGIEELINAIKEDRPHRFGGDHAAHLVEILEATYVSIRESRTVSLTSSFIPPAPFEWAT